METFEAEGPLGETVTVRARYNLLVPLAAGEKDERKAEKKAKVDAEKLDRIKAKVCRYLAGQDEPQTVRSVRTYVGGNTGTLSIALNELVEDGVLVQRTGDNNAKLCALNPEADLDAIGVTWNE